MKRIQFACLEQTVRFMMKDDDIPAPEAEQIARAEYERYLQQMDRNGIAYRVLEETNLPDGSVVVRLKRQYHSYPVGEYLK